MLKRPPKKNYKRVEIWTRIQYTIYKGGVPVITVTTRRDAQVMAMALMKDYPAKHQKIAWVGEIPETQIQKLYAVFSPEVQAKDKYKLTTPPSMYFSSREAAHQWAKKAGMKRSQYKVMVY